MELNVIGCLLLVPMLLWPEELKETQSVLSLNIFYRQKHRFIMLAQK